MNLRKSSLLQKIPKRLYYGIKMKETEKNVTVIQIRKSIIAC